MDIFEQHGKETRKLFEAYQKMQRRYIDWFMGLSSASDVLQTGVFPDAKEITESFACFRAVMKKVAKQHSLDPNDTSVMLVSVGDGCTPRTAALFAFLTKWTCVSVDPALDGWEQPTPQIKRLITIAKPIEECPQIALDQPAVVVCCHSHAKPEDVFAFANNHPVVALPCCVHYPDAPIEWNDYGVWSPHNRMKVYV